MVGCSFTNVVVGSNPSVVKVVTVTLRFELLQNVSMNYELYLKLFTLIESDIAKQNADMRNTIYPKLMFVGIRFFLTAALVTIYPILLDFTFLCSRYFTATVGNLACLMIFYININFHPFIHFFSSLPSKFNNCWSISIKLS